MQRVQRYLLLLGLVWYVSILAYSQIFIYSGTKVDAELQQISVTGYELIFINLVALIPFLIAVYVVNFNYVPAVFNAILGNRRLIIFYMTILAVAIFHAFYHGDIRSIQYNALLLISIPAFSLIWKRFSNDISLVFSALSISLLGYLVAVPLVYGAPVDRFYGAIHPNTYGGIAVTAAACISLSKRPYLRIGQFVSLAGAISVDSRFSALGILIIIGGQQILSAITTGARAWGPWLGVGLLAAVALYFSASILEIFGIEDADRGLVAGIAGRVDLWQLGIDYIAADILGYGFKNSYDMTSGHNGFLNLAIQFGLMPAIVIVSTFIQQIWSLWNESRAERTNRAPKIRQTSQSIAMNILISFIALLAGGFFQPQLINFGDPIGVLFLMFLSRTIAARKNVENVAMIKSSPLSEGPSSAESLSIRW